jgi:hypothetical protein
MDRDIAALKEKLAAAPQSEPHPQSAAAIKEALGRPMRALLAASHTPSVHFVPAHDLELLLTLEKRPVSVNLCYRHADQAERYQVAEMEAGNHGYAAKIPSVYTDSQFPLEYYFEVNESAERALLYPGLSANLTQQPYFVVRRAKT